jgi:hypothetical protein
LQQISIPISIGELIDKITILTLKQSKIIDEKQLINVNRELQELNAIWSKAKDPALDISELTQRLAAVNGKLWDIEDRIRVKESNAQFDKEFIELARAVYMQNDLRASIKKEINTVTGSILIEEKSYKNY